MRLRLCWTRICDLMTVELVAVCGGVCSQLRFAKRIQSSKYLNQEKYLAMQSKGMKHQNPFQIMKLAPVRSLTTRFLWQIYYKESDHSRVFVFAANQFTETSTALPHLDFPQIHHNLIPPHLTCLLST